MKIEDVFVGARLIDSLEFSQGGTEDDCRRLKDAGIDGVVGYVEAMTPARLGWILDAGMGFIGVTYAGAYFNGADDERAHLLRLGVPLQRFTCFYDLEGQKSYDYAPDRLIVLLDDCTTRLQSDGIITGLYVGSPQPLTGPELARLKLTRYWKAPSLVLDRNGKDWSEPPGIGWCMQQTWPQNRFRDTGILVDVDFVTQDRKGRVPTWVVA